jgi:predicted enzyme related to lactoylglutathione lyase
MATIARVHKVVVDVEDQQRALEFWTRAMGFDVALDTRYGEERWLEVRSPSGGTLIVLGRTATGPGDRASVDPRLPTSNVMFGAEDVAAAYEHLKAKGVEFPQPPMELPFGWWSLFLDTEGNRFALMGDSPPKP